VDLAFVESMFLPEHEEEGRRKRHLTVTQAAQLTLEAGALRTVLVHLSPRYGPSDAARMDQIARSVNPTATVAPDLGTWDVPWPD